MYKKKSVFKKKLPKYSKGAKLAPAIGTLVGAGIGTAIAPGVGTQIGATLGGSAGSVVGGMMEDDGLANPMTPATQFVSPTYPTRGVDVRSFPMGGLLPYDYEVEKGEVVEGNAQLEGNQATQLSSNFQLVEGKTHANGGVKGAGGERVFSDRSTVSPEVINQLSEYIKVPNRKSGYTHAELQKIIAKKFGDAEYNSKVGRDKISQNTANMNAKMMELAGDIIFQDQENQKEEFEMGKVKGSPFKRKYQTGGDIELPLDSAYLNNLSPRAAAEAMKILGREDINYLTYIRNNPSKYPGLIDSAATHLRNQYTGLMKYKLEKDFADQMAFEKEKERTMSIAAESANKAIGKKSSREKSSGWGSSWGNSGYVPVKAMGGKLPKYETGVDLLSPRPVQQYDTTSMTAPRPYRNIVTQPTAPDTTVKPNNSAGIDSTLVGANVANYLMNQYAINNIKTGRPVAQEVAPQMNYTDRSGSLVNANMRGFTNAVASLRRSGQDNASNIQRLYANTLDSNAAALNNEVARRDQISGANAQLRGQSNARNIAGINQELDDRLANRVFKTRQSIDNRNTLTEGITSAIDNKNLLQSDRNKLTILMRQFQTSGVGGRFEDWLKSTDPALYSRAFNN